jgi:hypothetical protein
MDVQDFLEFPPKNDVAFVALTGWVVDTEDGLYVLGDHYPENYDFPARIKILNENIIYQILTSVSSLGGGKSSLFYKSEVRGNYFSGKNPGILVDVIFVSEDRSKNDFKEIKYDSAVVEKFVAQRGVYKFKINQDYTGDWLDQI